jgi:hypothetical protein
MGTPKAGYYTQDKKKIPSVTTVLGEFKNPNHLLEWAWNLGLQGIDYKDVRGKAANEGTGAHNLIDAWTRGDHLDLPTNEDGTPTGAHNAFLQFLHWKEQTRAEIVRSELRLVSEKHGFGGTLDCMLEIDGKLALGDWKTSKKIYSDYIFQIAAYGILWEENFPDKPITGGYHIIRFSKDDSGNMSHASWSNLDRAKQGFLMMVELYHLKKELEKNV